MRKQHEDKIESVQETSSQNFLYSENEFNHDKSQSENSSSTDTDMDDIKSMDQLGYFNEYLRKVSESPIRTSNLNFKYVKDKVKKVGVEVTRRLMNVVNNELDKSTEADDEESRESKDFKEMIIQLQEKFKIAGTNEQFQILTSMPKSWSRNKLAKTFNTTEYKARKAKEIVSHKGVHEIPILKTREKNTVMDLTVIEFYLSELISRVMAGRVD